MSYGFKKGSGKSLPIVITPENAISKGRFIDNIEYRISDSGAEYLSVTIRDKDGKIARRSYFPPKLGVGFVNSQETLEKEMRKLNGIIENIAKTILGNSYETGIVNSFKELCTKVITDMGRSYSNKDLRVKLVYDSKNRASLPGYGPMMEDPTVISDDASNLKVNVRDRVAEIKPIMDKDEIPNITTNKANVEDDLPF